MNGAARRVVMGKDAIEPQLRWEMTPQGLSRTAERMYEEPELAGTVGLALIKRKLGR